MAGKMNRKIVLEDGTEYLGYGFGAEADDRVCEMVFDTSMVGYQEVVSDPTYANMAVVMTYPLIGNFGIAEEFEAKSLALGMLIVREYNDSPSNFRYSKTLSEYMEENGIPGIHGMDTRKLTRAIRSAGTQKVMITGIDTPVEKAVEIIKNTEMPHDMLKKASCKKKWYARTSNPQFSVVAIDCGAKLSAVRVLNSIGCNVTVVPYNTPAEEIAAMNPHGIIITDGPGNPEDAPELIETVKALRGKYPIFGIALGQQVIALAAGAAIMKLKFGHHGGNHPVRNIKTGKIAISCQNHNFAVDALSLDGTGFAVTHNNVLDGTVEGIECAADRIFGVQYNPESTPTSDDSRELFDHFIALMKEAK